MHRVKADEAYEIGEPGTPSAAYLDLEAMVALAGGWAPMPIYPGYGFLSENPELRAGVRARRG